MEVNNKHSSRRNFVHHTITCFRFLNSETFNSLAKHRFEYLYEAYAMYGAYGTCPAQTDTLEFLSLVVKAPEYTVHDEFVLCALVGTSHLGCVDPLLANRAHLVFL